MRITIGHLYPATMSTYGDVGNIICLQQRAAWRDIEVIVKGIELGEPTPQDIDLYFFGGGQDQAQITVGKDLQNRSHQLRFDTLDGVPLLAICGGYQLLGEAYFPDGADPIPGISLLPVQTKASSQRMIGDLILTSNLTLPGTERTIVGFENHSGKTSILSPEAQPLGIVRHGFGNNGDDKTEGCILGSIIGCYLHGSLLPKNPHLADWLLERAIQRHTPTYSLKPLDDHAEWQAHHFLLDRYPQ